MYSGGSGLSIDIHFELSYDVLSPLPIVLSKHFNHPHPYIEIATAISDDPSCYFDLFQNGVYKVLGMYAAMSVVHFSINIPSCTCVQMHGALLCYLPTVFLITKYEMLSLRLV